MENSDDFFDGFKIIFFEPANHLVGGFFPKLVAVVKNRGANADEGSACHHDFEGVASGVDASGGDDWDFYAFEDLEDGADGDREDRGAGDATDSVGEEGLAEVDVPAHAGSDGVDRGDCVGAGSFDDAGDFGDVGDIWRKFDGEGKFRSFSDFAGDLLGGVAIAGERRAKFIFDIWTGNVDFDGIGFLRESFDLVDDFAKIGFFSSDDVRDQWRATIGKVVCESFAGFFDACVGESDGIHEIFGSSKHRGIRMSGMGTVPD